MRYDLHCHTIFSDGDQSVDQLLQKATQIQLDGLAITDHDTVGAYQEAVPLAKNYNLKLLSGIELSCLHGDKSVHVLAYSFSLKPSPFINFIDNCQKIRHERNLKMIEKLAKLGIVITEEELRRFANSPHEVVGRPHFAALMIEKGYVTNYREAFDKYLGEGKQGFTEGCRPQVEEALEMIKKANAFSVLAHPHLMQDNKLVTELIEMPFDGIECFYAKILPEQEKKWVEIARKKNKIATGGSDFHGACKPLIDLGCSWVTEEIFDPLYARFLENEQLSKAK